jgi:hypothetical protein
MFERGSSHGLHGAGGEGFATEGKRERSFAGHAGEQDAALAAGFTPEGEMARIGFAVTRREPVVDALLAHDPVLAIRELHVAAPTELGLLGRGGHEHDAETGAGRKGTKHRRGIAGKKQIGHEDFQRARPPGQRTGRDGRWRRGALTARWCTRFAG